jgi:hypothetical protein
MLGKRGKIGGLACFVAIVVGCSHEVQPDYPSLPLLVSKKPIEPKSERKDTVLGLQEPILPAPPPTALASLPPDFEKFVRFVKRTHAPDSPGEGAKMPMIVPKSSPDGNSP